MFRLRGMERNSVELDVVVETNVESAKDLFNEALGNSRETISKCFKHTISEKTRVQDFF